jgi:hypothetical protein
MRSFHSPLSGTGCKRADQVLGNGSPAWLAVFDPTGGGEFQEDDSNSYLPTDLRPDESAVEAVVFDTRTPTGTFTLRTNDQLMSVIASCTLQSPSPIISQHGSIPERSQDEAIQLCSPFADADPPRSLPSQSRSGAPGLQGLPS